MEWVIQIQCRLADNVFHRKDLLEPRARPSRRSSLHLVRDDGLFTRVVSELGHVAANRGHQPGGARTPRFVTRPAESD